MKRRSFAMSVAAAGFAAVAALGWVVNSAEAQVDGRAHPQANNPTDIGAFEGRYDITLMGMQIGVAQLKATVTGDDYKIDVWTRLTGLAGVMTGGKGAASASGALSGATVRPSKFAVTTASGDKSVSVQMALADGGVQALKITPAIPERKQRIALRDEDIRNIVDPVSALLMPVAGKAMAGDPAACNRILHLFDGSARFDVPLTFTSAQKINGRAFAGTVAICSGRYRPIAGHVPNRPETIFMENNKDIEVWLAPSPDGRLFIPYRISVRSPVGLVVIEASRFPGGRDTPSPTPTVRASK